MPNLKFPPLNAIRAFDAAARLGSYVEAAKALHVTQPAVGRHVKLLEDFLGIVLFERTSRGVTLTPPGRKYHQKIARALQLIIDAGEQAQPHNGDRWLRIMAVPGFAKRWLTPRLESIRHLRPGLKLAIEPNSTFADIDGKTADIGVGYGWEGQYPHVRATLITPRVFPVCSPSYLANIDPINSVKDLLQHHLLHYDDGEWWNTWLRSQGVDAQLSTDVLYLNNDHVLSLAESGQGIALANEVLVKEELEAGTLVRVVEAQVALESYQLVTSGKEVSADVEWFQEWLMGALRAEFPGVV